MRRILEIAILIAAAGASVEAQSRGHLPVVCVTGNGHAPCTRLLPPKPRIDPPLKQLQPPEEQDSVSIDLAKLGITAAAVPRPREPASTPSTPDRAIAEIGVVLPTSGLVGSFGDVLEAVRRHRAEEARVEKGQLAEIAGKQRSERRLAEQARGLMDSLRTDLREMNDLAPGLAPDITVDRSAPAKNAAQIKGQLVLSWQDMRDDYCKLSPGAKYAGLDSNPKHCADPEADREKRAADEALDLMEYIGRDLSRISIQEQDHAKELRCAEPCPWTKPPRLTTLSSSDPQTERIIQTDRVKWLEMREMYCHYYHGAEYVDLEFKRQTCPR